MLAILPRPASLGLRHAQQAAAQPQVVGTNQVQATAAQNRATPMAKHSPQCTEVAPLPHAPKFESVDQLRRFLVDDLLVDTPGDADIVVEIARFYLNPEIAV